MNIHQQEIFIIRFHAVMKYFFLLSISIFFIRVRNDEINRHNRLKKKSNIIILTIFEHTLSHYYLCYFNFFGYIILYRYNELK